jgi:hypothetical protein
MGGMDYDSHKKDLMPRRSKNATRAKKMSSL